MVIDVALQTRFDARVEEVEAYERTWWARRVEPQLTYLRKNPAVRAALYGRLSDGQPAHTTDVYSRDRGSSWAPERISVHDGLLTELGTRDDLLERADLEPAVYFLLGLPGSGKSSSLRPLALKHAGLVDGVPVIDADAVRVEFPEYETGLGSGTVQDETALLTYGLGYRAGDGTQRRTLARGGVVMLDTIGDAAHLPRVVEQVASQGRRVYVLRTDCPPDVCRERAMRRSLDRGRYVPLELIDGKAGYPEAALEAARATGHVDGWAVVDTSANKVKITGSPDFTRLTP